MADPLQRLPGNAPGRWFVDASCIDCDQCRQIAPDTFVVKLGVPLRMSTWLKGTLTLSAPV